MYKFSVFAQFYDYSMQNRCNKIQYMYYKNIICENLATKNFLNSITRTKIHRQLNKCTVYNK